MSRSTMVLGVLVALMLPASASAKDYAETALNIIPSGQYGGVPVPPDADVQAKMYDGLTPLFDQVTAGDLTTYFKSARLGSEDSCPCRSESVPRKGVTIVRDSFNVPHITGRDRLDLSWAAGWVLLQDRALLVQQGRYAGRFAALDAPGIDAFALVTGLKQVTVTKQADRIIERAQTAALLAQGAEGRALLRDVDAYVDGMNARLAADKLDMKPFTRVDVYAVNALAGQIFGQGGGDEARRSMLLSGLQQRLGEQQGQTVWDDLTDQLDADRPTTVSKSFPYEHVPSGDRSGSAVVDDGSLNVATARGMSTATRAHQNMSNFLLVGGSRSTNGHPLFVAGPQIGYFYPGLTLEMDLKAPGIEARGAAIPAGVGNILIGRAQDYAWTLTSAHSDTNDQFVETLCGGSDTKYRYKGKCLTMGRINAGSIAGQGPVVYRTTVHGPVLGYATVDGRRVAISFQRSSQGKDILWQLMFKRFTDGKVTGLQSFYDAAATSPFTFNVGYADDRNIATYSAGALPMRDPRVDPRLPTKGTGQYEWRGFLNPRAHPHEANPASGTLVNWNNMPAPGFGAADDVWAQGSIQRVQMLNAGLAKRQQHDLASVTGAMNAAATQDLRAAGTLLPAIAGVLSGGPAPSARSQSMLDLLVAWRDGGSSRLDRDGDGRMDAGGAPAIMDAVYPRIADAVLGPVLGPQLGQLSELAGETNSPQSGFTGGRINYVDKDLRTLLGTQFRSPFATKFCGNGDLAACREALWGAFEAAGAALAEQQGSPDPNAWTSDAAAEMISFAPGLLTTKIRYTNRPSGIQQVLSFSGHRPKRR